MIEQQKIELKEIPTTCIVFGDRFREDYGDITGLIESFKKEGIIQPLAVRDNGDGTYHLLAGGRRYTAATKVGLPTVPVRCYPSTLSELEMRSIELMENVQRKDLDWLEAAKLKKEIHLLQVAIYGEKTSTSPDAPGASKRGTAAMLGVAASTLVQDINLANAVEMFPELAKAKDKKEAQKMLSKLEETVVRQELSRRIEEKTANSSADKIHHSLINAYIIGDLLEGLKGVPASSIDFVEFDPPYAIDLNQQKRDMGDRANSYNEVDKDNYGEFMLHAISECYRVMSANSWMVLWHAKEWLPILLDFAKTAGFDGNVNNLGIWYKGDTGQTNSPDIYLASCYEQFLYLRKGKPSIIRQGRSNVFYYKPVTSSRKIHPTERPIELIQDILQTFCWEGARCVSPCLGSGNTILAASNLGIQAFGWDLSKEYKDNYIIRVAASRPTGYKSYKEVIVDAN